MSKRKNKGFVMRSALMMDSPAFRALSLTGHRILARLEIEHCQHRGKKNGSLIATHAQFCQFGIHGHCVGPGLREVEALGLMETTERGRAGNAEYRKPSKYRLTYLPANGSPATNEWAKIESPEEAETIAAKARAIKLERPRTGRGGRKSFRWRKMQKPLAETAIETPPISMVETASEGPDSSMAKTASTSKISSHLVSAPPLRGQPVQPAATAPRFELDPTAMQEYAGVGGRQFTLVNEPWAMRQYGTKVK